ncbi:hypothetical protein ACGF5C_03780 [Micromonospora sp. NPDC047620]|uniref:hypothetical protein n=1 Tax=Micromonospora sp. NPDC047620 TaxID=3364251 RepID=UPI00371DEF4B
MSACLSARGRVKGRHPGRPVFPTHGLPPHTAYAPTPGVDALLTALRRATKTAGGDPLSDHRPP